MYTVLFCVYLYRSWLCANTVRLCNRRNRKSIVLLSIFLLARCRKEHCGDFFFFADVFSHFLLFYFPPAYKKLYYPDIFSLNNTWVKREIGRICGELQTRAEGLTCSNPVGASLCGPRTSRGLWPGLDVAVNGGGGGCHCLSSGPSADLFPAFGGIVENLAGRSCYYRPDSVDASQPLMRRTGLSC